MTQIFEERIAALDIAADAETLNRAVADMERVRDLLGQHTGREPGIPPVGVMNEVYELLHRVFSPDGLVGRGVIDNGPEYPTRYLPAPMTAQLAARGSLHVAGIASGMLGCASAANMSTRLLVDGSRTVLPTLWIPLIGSAGCGKTPAHEIAFKPYEVRESQANKAYARELVAWSDLDRNERKQHPRPINEARLANDFTMESLVRRMKTPHESVALVADELSGLLKSIGQYKKDGGADKARFLSCWSGQPWLYDRVGNADDPTVIYIEQPIMPIFGTIQPEFVSLLGDVGSGMQARWLPHLCGERDGDATGALAPEWDAAANLLLDQINRRREWTLSGDSEARAEHREAERRWAAERKDPSQTPASDSFLAKGGEHALRVALNLAEVDAAGEAAARGRLLAGSDLPVWAVRAGVDLVDYCAGVWRSLPSTEPGMARSYADRAVVERDGKLNAWLRGREEKSASRRDIYRAKVAGSKTYEDVDALIERHRAIYGDDAVGKEARKGLVAYAR